MMMTKANRVLGVLVFVLWVATACASSEGSGNPGGGGDGGVVPPAGDGGSVIVAPENLIDNLDDGDSAIEEIGGRIGAWYTYNDETAAGEQTPSPAGDFVPTAGGPNDSGFMARTTGAGFAEWGAGMGFDLNNPGDAKGVWDASQFTGIAFVARGDVPVRVAVAVQGVVPVADGGTCTPGTTEAEECDDAHGRTIVLSDDWRQFSVPFSDMTQEGWGQAAAFDAAKVTGVQFQIPAGVAFDTAIDEIGFY